MNCLMIFFYLIVNIIGIEMQSLYSGDKHVISIDNDTMSDSIFNKNHAILLQFYNSYCGHCRRFAPKYKELAFELYSLKDSIKLMAINCADDENNPVCRDYEIRAYPTLRYFTPHFSGDKNILGEGIESQIISLIKNNLAELMFRDNQLDNFVPEFDELTNGNREDLFHSLPNNVQYVFILYEDINSTDGAKAIIQYVHDNTLKIKRITSKEIAISYDIPKINSMVVIDYTTELKKPELIDLNNNKTIVDAIQSFKISKELSGSELESWHQTDNIHFESSQIDRYLLDEVIRNTHKVYQADLENAIHYIIYHEIISKPEITGDSLLALQKFLNILSQYHPLNNNGERFLNCIKIYVNIATNQTIRGEDLQNEINKISKEYTPVFSANRWIGCVSSTIGLRGYTCGLWKLFHYMTIESELNADSRNATDVLLAIHGYVKYFFGCADCSNHFQAMAERRKILQVKDKADAVLWLWAAHNEVNKRLAGDTTEDPKFPKIQFPSRVICPKCWREINNENNNNNNGSVWNESEVLNFLKYTYDRKNISYLGVKKLNVLAPTLASHLVQPYENKKVLFSNVLTDLDMRVGILLYAFCACMMLFAVKMFICRGYRKKLPPIYENQFKV